MDPIASTIKHLLITELQTDAALIENADLQTPLLGRGIGLDSIEALRLVLGLEKEFNIQIPDSELSVELFSSIGALAVYVERKILQGKERSTIPTMLNAVTEQHSTRPALVSGDRVITYAQLQERVHLVAGEIARRGVAPGDRVGLLLRNSPEFVIAYLAILNTGALAVPLNDHYQQSELLLLVNECAVSLLVTSETFRPLCESVLPQTQKPCPVLWVEAWSGLQPNAQWNPPAISPDAPVMFQFSSGSTGRPKRVARTHRMLTFELASLNATLGLTAVDRFLGVAPFSHVNGLMRSMLASLSAGAALYPMSFDRRAVAEAVERERLTVFIAVPFMFITLAQTNLGGTPDWRAMRLCISASAPLPARFNREFQSRFGIYIRQLYGSTETGTISVNRAADPADTLESVGTPIHGVQFDVVDDAGRSVETGQVGQVIVSSPGVIHGYDGLPQVNREVFRDGWFYTGDLGKLDANGMLTLQGRISFLINKGGFKIDPREVELLLESHPCVEEVAVVGVPTAYGDEKVKAVIVTRADCSEREIVEFCRGKIADFKIPSVIEFRDALPKSPTGKIHRSLLVQNASN